MTNTTGRPSDRCGGTRVGGVAAWALIFATSVGCTGLLGFDDVAFRDEDGGGGAGGGGEAGAGNAAGAQDDGGLGGTSGSTGGTGGSTGGTGGATGGTGGSTGGTGGATGGTGGSTGGTGGSTGGTGGSTGGTGGSTGGTGGSTGGTGGSTGGTGGTGGVGGSTGGTGGATGGSGGSTLGSCDAGPGKEIVDLLNDYRAQNGLSAVPCSPSLMVVADTHVHDLYENQPHTVASCNLHSWSDQGTWSACCYTADHAQAQCMWDKPRELTVYTGNGYENAAAGASSPSGAITMWKNSSAHNAVMLNEGIWASHPWKAVGAALYQGYAVLWFGEQTDPDG